MIFYRKLNLVAFIGVLTFLGSLAGLVSTFIGFFHNTGGLIGFFFLSIAFLYFLTGVFFGARLPAEQSQFRLRSIWFWWIQVPVLNSGYLSFHAVTAVFCAFWLRLDVFDVGSAVGIASQFEIGLMTGGPVSIGVNILALAIVLFLQNIKNEKFSVPNENF